MAKVDLEKTVNVYCHDIRKKVKDARLESGINRGIYDYPATAIVAADPLLTFSARGSSYRVKDSDYDKVPVLQNKLRSLGKIGRETHSCKNLIGACAEPHAAKSILTRSRNTVSLHSIRFSVAYRPRTMEPVERCENCVYTFK